MVTSYMRRHRQNATRRSLGFTLIEMVIVIAIVMILLSMAVAKYDASIRAARDATLRQNLFTLRHVIQEFTLDKQRAPQSLDELKQAGYLSEIPKDPCTKQQTGESTRKTPSWPSIKTSPASRTSTASARYFPPMASPTTAIGRSSSRNQGKNLSRNPAGNSN